MKKASNWKLLGAISLALFAMVAGILLHQGFTEAGVRMVIRATARSSLLLLLLAFSASSLRRLWQTSATAWLLRNRRYIGVSFAVSHFLHLLAIQILNHKWPARTPDGGGALILTIGGGLAYLLIVAMVATSFDRSAAWLGTRKWRWLHTIGSYYVLGIFAMTYLPRALKEPGYLPTMIGIALALLLRAAARLKKAKPA